MKLAVRDNKEINLVSLLSCIYMIGLIFLFNSGWKYWAFMGSYFIIFFSFTLKLKLNNEEKKEKIVIIKNKISIKKKFLKVLNKLDEIYDDKYLCVSLYPMEGKRNLRKLNKLKRQSRRLGKKLEKFASSQEEVKKK